MANSNGNIKIAEQGVRARGCLNVAVCDSKNITHTPCGATKQRKRQKRVCEGEGGRRERACAIHAKQIKIAI